MNAKGLDHFTWPDTIALLGALGIAVGGICLVVWILLRRH